MAAFNKEVQTLDGLYSTSRENLILSHLTSDQLVEINLETGEYEGALAASYAWVDDRTIDFTLREGLTFHDGAPVPSKTLYIPSNGSQTKTRKHAAVPSFAVGSTVLLPWMTAQCASPQRTRTR